MPSKSATKGLTILIVPLDGYGHINATIGVGQQLVKRGHRVIYAIEAAWKGTVDRYAGLEEVLYVDKTRKANLAPCQHWIEFMEECIDTFQLDPIDAMEAMPMELNEMFFHNFLNVEEDLQKIIKETKPDVIVLDSYVTVPAVYNSGVPWVLMTSAAPLSCLPHPDLPPSNTGYPTKGDRSQWTKFEERAATLFVDVMERYNKKMSEYGIPTHPPGATKHDSPFLNIYAYPEELDYLDIRPLPEKWKRFDHFIRFNEKDSTFEIPKDFLNSPRGKLIYVSMGSMGCADVALMQRLIDILSKSPNRFIFSLGPKYEQLTLSDNIFGHKFLPQTQVLPLVDLVITHGGNNTLLESLYFAKPIIVTPLFGDQLDNAQRVSEVGLGYRLHPYKCDPEELRQKIEDLLADKALAKRLQQISERMQNSNSTENVAIAIEDLVN